MSIQLVPGLGEGSNGRVVARVRSLKGLFGLSQTALADALGLAQPQMSKRLKGAVQFSLGEVDALAKYFGTTAGYLLGYEEGPAPRDPLQPAHPERFELPTFCTGVDRAPATISYLTAA